MVTWIRQYFQGPSKVKIVDACKTSYSAEDRSQMICRRPSWSGAGAFLPSVEALHETAAAAESRPFKSSRAGACDGDALERFGASRPGPWVRNQHADSPRSPQSSRLSTLRRCCSLQRLPWSFLPRCWTSSRSWQDKPWPSG